MKKLLFSLLFLVGIGSAHGSHLYTTNANNIQSGTLPNERLDPSSVTLQGNDFNFSSTFPVITTRLNNLDSSTETLQTNINNLYTNVTATHAALTTAINSTYSYILEGNATSYITINAEPQVKAGALTVSSFTVGGLMNVSSMNVIGTITSTSGYAGGKSTGTFGGLKCDIITLGDGTFLSSSPFSGGGSASTHPYLSDLFITTNSADTNEWAITAKLRLGDTTISYSTSVKMNITGMGGCDTAEATSTWYKLFIGYRTQTDYTVVATSQSNSVPVLTGGYYWIPLGTVYNDGSSNLVPTVNRNGFVELISDRMIVSGSNPGDNYTSISVTNYIPSGAISVKMQVTAIRTTGDIGYFRIRSVGKIGGTTYISDGTSYSGFYHAGASANLIYKTFLELPLVANTNAIEYAQRPGQEIDAIYIGIRGYTEVLR